MYINKRCSGAVMVDMWSACSSYTPIIRVQIPLKFTVFAVKMNENKQKRPRLAYVFF